MAAKKDPGKFTVRFNTADPQQQTVIELLNQQGRYKAQFLTNAILHYVHCPETPDIQALPMVDSKEIERIVLSVLAQQQTVPLQEPVGKTPSTNIPREIPASHLEDADTIFKTLEAFQQQ